MLRNESKPTGPVVHQRFDDRAEVLHPQDKAASVYRYGSDLPKACVHPLNTPAGHCLSGFEMSDHVWHRGLWFTIKYLNETNFWEEHEPYGIHLNDAEPGCEIIDTNTVRVTHPVRWESDATGLAIREKRALTFRSEDDGTRVIDWNAELTPTKDLKLDRTPYTTWGGYGGLSLRGSREMHNVQFVLPGGATTEGLAGESHDWVLMQGDVDGGPEQKFAFAIIDHPHNPRSPSPWYAKCNGMNYINAAFLFHEPMEVKGGVPLSFKYRVCYRDGHWDADAFVGMAERYRQSK